MPTALGVRGSVGVVGGRRLPILRLVLTTVAFAVVGSAALVSLIDHQAAAKLAPVGVFVGLGAAAILLLGGSSVYKNRERFSWRLIGTGMGIGSLGVLVVGLIETTAGSVPTFGPHDLIFITAYLTMLTGFAIMPHLGSMLRSRIRVMLDGLIGALSMATLIWVVFYPALQDHLSSATYWERFAGVAYPVLDSLMVVVAMIVTIRRSSWRFDLRIILIGVGMVVQAFGDLSLLTTGVGASFEEATPNFFLFLVADACYVTSAALIRRKPRPREYADRRQPLWAMLAPYGASLVVGALIVFRIRASQIESDIQLLLLSGVMLICLVVARQAVALREYRSLVQQQRSALVSSVSHELRTPLTAMVGFLDVLKDPSVALDPLERTELTDVAHQQALYMSRIVADLLLLARDSSGFQLQESEVRLGSLIPDALRSIPETQGVVETDIEPHLVAYLDGDRLRQVLANLVVNALRYGRGRVEVVAFSAGSDLVLEVHDDGEGVPRKYELAIWEQFERGNHRLNSTVPGSGIGLSIVDMIIRRHGGLATYERSKRLGGACFKIVLPGRLRGGLPAEAPISGGLRAARA
ncbi:MAG: sensor histidine kinase [Acidimicrobiia bacterium]